MIDPSLLALFHALPLFAFQFLQAEKTRANMVEQLLPKIFELVDRAFDRSNRFNEHASNYEAEIKASFEQGLTKWLSMKKQTKTKLYHNEVRTLSDRNPETFATYYYYALESALSRGASTKVAIEYAGHAYYYPVRYLSSGIKLHNVTFRHNGTDKDSDRRGIVDGILKELIAHDQRTIAKISAHIKSGDEDYVSPDAPIHYDPTTNRDGTIDTPDTNKPSQKQSAPAPEPSQVKSSVKSDQEPETAKVTPTQIKERGITLRQAKDRLWGIFVNAKGPKSTLDGFKKRLDAYEDLYSELASNYDFKPEELERMRPTEIVALYHSYTFNESSGNSEDVRLENLISGLALAQKVGLDVYAIKEHRKRCNSTADTLLATTLTSRKSVVDKINAFDSRYTYMSSLEFDMSAVAQSTKVRSAVKSYLNEYIEDLNSNKQLTPEGRKGAFIAMFASFLDKGVVSSRDSIRLVNRVH